MNVIVRFICLQAYSRHYVVKLISVLFCRSVHAQLLAYYTCTNYFFNYLHRTDITVTEFCGKSILPCDRKARTKRMNVEIYLY